MTHVLQFSSSRVESYDVVVWLIDYIINCTLTKKRSWRGFIHHRLGQRDHIQKVVGLNPGTIDWKECITARYYAHSIKEDINGEH